MGDSGTRYPGHRIFHSNLVYTENADLIPVYVHSSRSCFPVTTKQDHGINLKDEGSGKYIIIIMTMNYYTHTRTHTTVDTGG